MVKQFRVRHETHYAYAAPVALAQNEARVQLRDTAWQWVEAESVILRPDARDRRERVDYFGNRTLYFSIQEAHDEFRLIVESLVAIDITKRPRIQDESLSLDQLTDWLLSGATGSREARRWAWASRRVPPSPKIAQWTARLLSGERQVFTICQKLMAKIHSSFTYDVNSTGADTPVNSSFAQRSGVCQDFAHIMIAGLRSLGISCRYVSGYLQTRPPPGKARLIGADATHAWVSVFFPGVGWVDFDPTNNCLADERYLTLAWGRDVADVAPLKGVILGGESHTVSVSVDVEKVSLD